MRYLSPLLILSFICSFVFAQERVTGVELATVNSTEKVEEILAVGTLFPFSDIVIKPEVSGKVVSINFEEGKSVNEGAVLIQFDDRIQRAKVKDAKAKFEVAKQNESRLTAAKAGATAQLLDEAKSTVLQTQAAYEIALAELDKMILTAPFPGMVGLKNIDLGDYIQAGTNVVRLSYNDELKLEFNIPERVAHVARVGQRVEFTIDNYPNEVFEAEVYAISPEIELEGRSLAIRAKYNNNDGRLFPGMFARLRLQIPLGYQVVLVPEEAVFASEGKQYLYKAIPEEDGDNYRAKLVEVELGDRTSFSVEVLQGLAADDQIVKIGQLRIRDGALIKDLNKDE